MVHLNRRRGSKGFTLIELLIVVAIIGIIAAILIPNLIDALQKAKQKRVVGDERNVGAAWMSWLTDQVGAAAAGSAAKTYDFTAIGDIISATDLSDQLHPTATFFYIQEVPLNDGWGSSYEYRQATNVLNSQVIGVRAKAAPNPGTGTPSFETDVYEVGPFIATQYHMDIVWADGFFVRFPAGVKVQ